MEQATKKIYTQHKESKTSNRRLKYALQACSIDNANSVVCGDKRSMEGYSQVNISFLLCFL